MDKMKQTTICGEVVSIAEHTNYLELTSRICYYDEPNLNGDMLPYDENAETFAQTLVNQPVQAKYRVNQEGKPTFGSHEMHKKRDGSVTFSTESIGVHTKAWIENDNVVTNDGTIKELPCLFAQYRLWKRYPNMIAAATRLFDEKKLFSSWEISTYQYVYDNGIRKLTNYEFSSNCLLGYEYAYPSYGENATALSMAELQDNAEMLVAEALSKDMANQNIETNQQNKEENPEMAKKKLDDVQASVDENVKTDNAEQIETAPVENVNVESATETDSKDTAEKVEDKDSAKPDSNVAQLTVRDLRRKISEACDKKAGTWTYISFLFPNEKEVWCEYDGAETELDLMKFTYEVGENDEVTVSEPEKVKLSVSVAEINSTVANLEKSVETAKAELEVKDEAIAKASEKIAELNTQIAELQPYKEAAEEAEKQRIEAEITAEKDRLKQKLLKGNLFTEAEVAEKNIADLIEARDESAINSLIADKFVASFDVKENKETSDEPVVAESDGEIATASLEEDEAPQDAGSFMRSILFD